MTKLNKVSAIHPSKLYNHCSPDQFSFSSTQELSDIDSMLGQDRAANAVKFGIDIRHKGYNLYVMGPHGSGKHTLVHKFLEQQAQSSVPPADWLYVYNFEQPHKPNVLRLPAGFGIQLQKALNQLIDELQTTISSAFESDEYQSRMEAVEQELKNKQQVAIEDIQHAAEKHQIKLLKTSDGFVFAPTRDGEILDPDDFNKLSEPERQRLEAIITDLQNRLKKVIDEIPRWSKETRERVKELNRQTAERAISLPISELQKSYNDLPDVSNHLDLIKTDILENVNHFRNIEDGALSFVGHGERRQATLNHYRANLLVDHSQSQLAPVIYEDQPTYQNLVGRVEHVSQMGTLITDFTLIKSGALHKANGGYLILDAEKILTQPYAWEGLKRALRSGDIRIDSLGQLLSLTSTVSLEPQSIPLDIKIVLLGSRELYHLLNFYDPEFSELFKVAADFEDHVYRSDENNQLFARFISTICRKEKLRPLGPEAVCRVIEHASRVASDGEKLTTHMRTLCDLLSESDYWAQQNHHEIISYSDVQQTIDNQQMRHARLAEEIHDEVIRNDIHIATSGEKAGQINGLSVIALSNHMFGQPSRITATVRVGEGHIIDIEREVELGGPIHSKGVLILTSYLGQRYSKNRPLSFHASLVFEQSYGMVEGDSASLAELCVLISAIANAPIQQSLAITGSVNQHGEVQAIGGVNEKIEGFFEICKKRGLDGSHGVLIPADNVKHLMLNQEIIDAVKDKKFNIYPITHVDEASTLLMKNEAGERDEEGKFPEGSLNAAIEEALEELSNIRHAYNEPLKEGESDS